MPLRLAIASDLHFDTPGAGFLRSQASPHGLLRADVVILAGDSCSQPEQVPEVLSWVRRYSDAPIVLVLGNREWYGQSFPSALTAYREAAAAVPDVQLLEKDCWEFRGVRFLGLTLWTDFAQRRHLAHCQAELRLFQRVLDSSSGELLQASRICQAHEEAVAWLEQQFPAKNPTVVISHHAPSSRSDDPRFQEKPGSSAYWADLDAQIQRWQPALWIHGHIHTPVDYRLHRTRVFSNPWGYPKERAGCLGFRCLEIPGQG
jgi:predicted phosphodiesterase